MWRASRRLISSTIAASVVVFPEPVGPPSSTSPRGSCASNSTVCGSASVDRRGTRVGRSLTVAAARPRSLCRLIRKRPTPTILNDASAMRSTRYSRCACGASAGSTASSMSTPSSGPSASVMTLASRRIAGGAPATSSRSLPLRAPSSRSHCSSRDVLPPRTSDADCVSTLEFSSTISRSMSSGSCVTAAAAPGSSCSTAAAGHRQGAPRSRRARPA